MCGVYIIKNLINGKVYIGQSIDIQNRFLNHKSESFNPKSNAYNTAIHRAIRKYGIDNFSFEIIEECKKEDLYEREKYWIKYYNSYGEGYNLTPGGEGVVSIDYDKARKLWDDGLSIAQIASEMNCSKHTIIFALKNYENYNSELSFQRGRKITGEKRSKRKIYQYSLDGDFIREYNSSKEIEVVLGIKPKQLSSVFSGKQNTAGGFQWSKERVEKMPKYIPRSTNVKRPVQQINDNNEVVNEFDSIADAVRAMNQKSTSGIWGCCQNSNHKSCGFYWRYKE